MDGDSEISPGKAASLLAALVLVGGGIFAVAVLVDTRSSDPLYDPQDMSKHTPSTIMETQDLWKKKEPPKAAPPPAPLPATMPGTTP